ncbi:hypothetical protein COY05_04830 [Candidatus Peregrinibacteria bacterium CG_4_10_14_0_2_um_filter_38_24]|nr:MAG: hypothetical protein COY05_04830 [Candidatus Peregrinibacteria bacterium CG_4_10_14_0_2_um_filter_38_24]
MENPENRPVRVEDPNNKGLDNRREGSDDANNEAREAAERAERQRLIFGIEERIKMNGFDSRSVLFEDGGKKFASDPAGNYTFQLVENGKAKYTLVMNARNQEFTLSRNDAEGRLTQLGKSKDLNAIDFPSPVASIPSLLDSIQNGGMDKCFGDTKFSMKAEMLANHLHVYNFSKVGVLGDEPAFSLTFNSRSGEYVLALTVVKKSGEKTSITSKELGRGLNPYTLINWNSSKILPHLSDGRLNRGDLCSLAPRIYPPSGKFDRLRKK